MIYGTDHTTLEPERCCNCQKVSDELIPLLNKWNFKACPECAEWSHAVETGETCPELHRAIINSKTIDEVRQVIRAHQGAECVHCGATKKTAIRIA